MNRKLAWFLGAGLLVALILAGVVSNFASRSPDGLDATTLQGCTTDAGGNITGGECIAQQAEEGEGPLADYGIKGIDNPYLSTGLAGVAGVLVTFAIGGGLFWVIRHGGAKNAGGTENAGDTTNDSDTKNDRGAKSASPGRDGT